MKFDRLRRTEHTAGAQEKREGAGAGEPAGQGGRGLRRGRPGWRGFAARVTVAGHGQSGVHHQAQFELRRRSGGAVLVSAHRSAGGRAGGGGPRGL